MPEPYLSGRRRSRFIRSAAPRTISTRHSTAHVD